MESHGPKSQAFFERAQKVLPYGVSCNYRYWGDITPVVADARGGYIYDFDGKRFIDFRLGYGPIILGHAHPFVNQRVAEAIEHGTVFAATHEYEVRAAERMIAMCPGIDLVRFINTGAEATMHALRLARGYTGRDLILKFEGSYHGAYDYMLWSTPESDKTKIGTRQKPRAQRTSIGAPEVISTLVQTCPWNDIEILGDILAQRGEEIAAIILEPILGNASGLMPAPGFLEFVRQQCDQHGIVLIYDQVKTGFRISPSGAGDYLGVQPDISTFAKALGNGFPVAAIAGKRDFMLTFGPGKVLQAGTYNANIVSTAAADATLEYMQTQPVFEHLNQIGSQLMNGLSEILARHNVAHHMHGTPTLFGFTLSETEPKDWRDVLECDLALHERMLAEMFGLGVLLDSDPQQTWYVCAAHTSEDVAETLEKFDSVVKKVLQ